MSRLGELLVKEKLLTPEQLEHALNYQKNTGSPLGQIVISLGYVKRIDLYRLLAKQMNVDYAGEFLSTFIKKMDKQIAMQFHPDDLNRLLFFPLYFQGDELIVLAANLHDDNVDQLIKKVIDKKNFTINKKLVSELDITWMVEWTFKDKILEESVTGLFYRNPEESAVRVFTPSQLMFISLACTLFVLWLYVDWKSCLIFLFALVNLFFFTNVLFKFVLSTVGARYEWEEVVSEDEVQQLDDKTLPIYTILLPVFKEPAVIPKLIDGLRKIDYPQEKLDILLLLEEEDYETLEAAKKAQPPANFRFITIPNSLPKTKPKACNYGLAFARGKYLTIYDAEDIPEPDQLKKAIVAFRKFPKEFVCFQAALNYFNRDENFLTRMFTLEYSYWFDYMLTGLSKLSLPIPLGGTSNHFDTEKLRELGGWDPFNVTEDADLGIRAYGRGYKVGVLNSTTYEEANKSVKNWIRQRSRWQKGYAQTFLVHNRNVVKFLKMVGWKGFFTLQVFIGGSVFNALVAPFMWLIFLFWIVSKTTFFDSFFSNWTLYIGLFNLLVGNFLGIYLNMLSVFKRKYYDLTIYALANPIYWILLSIAAWKGVYQLFTNPFYWEKTDHGLTNKHVIEISSKEKEVSV